ncbi:MAG: PhoH family protein, partial [Eubacterium sp.]|nr:PhoH family protein [Eubacterium sp.]
AARVLRNVDGISFCELSSKDVVRHPLVQKIVEAYEKYEKKENGRSQKRSRTTGTGTSARNKYGKHSG